MTTATVSAHSAGTGAVENSGTTRPPPSATSSQPQPHASDIKALPMNEQFRLLRTRLDKLGYFDTFTVESSPLILRLLNDLVQTTESCKKLKLQSDTNSQERRQLEGSVEPLRQELHHMTKENNQLHLDLIRAADLRDERDRKAQMAFRKYQTEISDLKFLNKQLLVKVESEQKKADEERMRLENIMNLVGATVGKEIDGKLAKAKLDSRMAEQVPRIDVETGLEPMEAASVRSRFAAPDPHVGDMLQLAEAKMEHMDKVRQELKARTQDLEGEMQMLRDQVTVREQEIARLGSLLEAERSMNTGYRHHEERTDGAGDGLGASSFIKMSRIEQLEMQVDYLNESILELEKSKAAVENEKSYIRTEGEKRIRELNGEIERLNDRNKTLCEDLEKLERMVNELDKLRKPAVEAVRQQAKRAPRKPTISSTTRKTSVSSAATSVSTARSMIPTAITESTKVLVREVNELKEKNVRLRNELSDTQQSLLETSRKLQATTDQLKAAETRIQPEDTLTTVNPSNSTEEGDVMLQRRVVELEKRSWELEKQNEEWKQKCDSLVQLEAELLTARAKTSTLQQQCQEKEAEVLQLTRQVESDEQVREEIERHKRQLLTELTQVQTERDGLVRKQKDFELQIQSAKGELEVVNGDRDRIRQLYEQVNREVQSLRQSKMPHLTDVDRMMGELDMARLENEQLRDRLEKIKTDGLGDSNRALDGRSAVDSAEALAKEEPSYRTQENSTEELNVLSDRVQLLDKQNEQLKSELHERTATLEQVNASLRLVQRERTEFAGKVAQLENDLETQQRNMLHAKGEVDRMAVMQESQTMTVAEQRELINQLDAERDHWRHEIDKKTETIADHEDMIRKLKDQLGDTEIALEGSRADILNLQSHLKDQDREISSLQRQLDEVALEKEQLQSDARQHVDEIQSLSSDLEAMMKENQIMNKDLSDVTAMRDQLRENLETQSRHISYLEQLLETKENEKDQIMVSYRKLINEHSELESTLTRANELEANLKTDLVMKEKQILHFQRMEEEHMATMQQMRGDLEMYETQISNLTKSIGSLQQDLQTKILEKQHLNREIDTMRELLTQSQKSKDELYTRLAQQTTDGDRLRDVIQQAEREKDDLYAQLRIERDRVQKLELLVTQERIKLMSVEQTTTEVVGLKENLERKARQLQTERVEQADSLVALTSELMRNEQENRALKDQLHRVERRLSESQTSRVASPGMSPLTSLPMRSSPTTARPSSPVLPSARGRSPVASPSQPARTAPSLSPTSRSRRARIDQVDSELEAKVLSELEETKRQLHQYDVQMSEMRRSAGTTPVVPHRPSGNTLVAAPPVHTAGVSPTPSARSYRSFSVSSSHKGEGSAAALERVDEEQRSETSNRTVNSNQAAQLLDAWRAQLVVLRRQLASIPGSTENLADMAGPSGDGRFRSTSITSLTSTNRSPERSTREVPLGGSSQVPLSVDDLLRKSLDESERRRREMEEENRKLVSVMHQVSHHLQDTKSLPPSRASHGDELEERL